MSKYKNFFYRNGSQRVLMHTNMWEPLFQSTGTRVELLDHGVTCTQLFLRIIRGFQSLIPVYISAGSGWMFLMSLLHPHFCLVPSLCFRVHKYRKLGYFPVALMCISLTVNGFERPSFTFSWWNAHLRLCPLVHWISNWFVGFTYLLYWSFVILCAANT